MIGDKHRAVLGVVCVLHLCGKGLILYFYVRVLLTEGGLIKVGVCGFLLFLEIWCFEEYLVISAVSMLSVCC
jgi:hypothetical protein